MRHWHLPGKFCTASRKWIRCCLPEWCMWRWKNSMPVRGCEFFQRYMHHSGKQQRIHLRFAVQNFAGNCQCQLHHFRFDVCEIRFAFILEFLDCCADLSTFGRNFVLHGGHGLRFPLQFSLFKCLPLYFLRRRWGLCSSAVHAFIRQRRSSSIRAVRLAVPERFRRNWYRHRASAISFRPHNSPPVPLSESFFLRLPNVAPPLQFPAAHWPHPSNASAPALPYPLSSFPLPAKTCP